MTLHLLKHPVNPLAIEVLRSTQTESPAVVLLSPTGDLPQLPGVTLYHVSESDRMENGHGITYSQLVEMIFLAEKVVAW
jgi:hypothetical protein